MTQKQITLALCGALALAGCAHEKAHERTSVSAVTNEEVTGDPDDQGKTRMSYTVVDDKTALNRDSRSSPDVAAQDVRPDTMDGRRATAACQDAVYFNRDSAVLDTEAEKQLASVAECMKRHEVDHALVVGRTDPTGPSDHNDQLGLDRARAVAEYLRKLGVPEEDIRVRSKGEMASAESQELGPAERRANVSEQ
jgi:outer membrane protein OmpA-like peptidoglycan-associated protein